MTKNSDRRNHLDHDDGLLGAPLPDPSDVTKSQLPQTRRILNCSSEEAFAEICKILAVERLKLRANEGETILHHIGK